MFVSQVMTRNPACVKPTDKLSLAAQLMWEGDCGAVPVVQDGTVVAMITDRDICMATWSRGLPPDQVDVVDAMSTRLVCCSETDSIKDVENRLRSNQLRRLPVLSKDGRLVGIISLADIVGLAASTRPRDSGDVVETLAGICQRAASPRALAQSPTAS